MKKFRGESPNWRRRRVPTSMPQSTICLANSSRSLRVAASEKVGFISQRTLTQPIMQKFQQHKYSYFLRESKNILKILSSCVLRHQCGIHKIVINVLASFRSSEVHCREEPFCAKHFISHIVSEFLCRFGYP